MMKVVQALKLEVILSLKKYKYLIFLLIENNTSSTAIESTNNRIKISRAERKWEHDLFEYKQQIPKTSKDLIRRYGRNIRLDVDISNNLKPAKVVNEDSGDVDEDNDLSPERRRRQRSGAKRLTSYQRRQSKPKNNEQNCENIEENITRRPQKLFNKNKNSRRNAPIVNEQRVRRRQLSNNRPNNYQSSGESEQKEGEFFFFLIFNKNFSY